MMKLRELKLKTILGLVAAMFLLVACTSNEPKEETVSQEQESTEEQTQEMAEEEHDWVIHESGFGDVHLHKTLAAPETESTMDDNEGKASSEETAAAPEPITHEEFQQRIEPVTYIAGEPSRIEITSSTVPLVETETITAYNNKGKEKGTIQVVHDSKTGEIVSIAYTHHGHRDQYDISPGMSAKDVKAIRKDLKHMEHRGKYFLYSDVSNVMYVLDVKDNKGHEMTEVEFDEVEVEAIVWKDKKHHKDIDLLDMPIEKPEEVEQ